MRRTNKRAFNYIGVPLIALFCSLSAAAADQDQTSGASQPVQEPVASTQVFEDPDAFDGSADPFPDGDGFPRIDSRTASTAAPVDSTT